MDAGLRQLLENDCGLNDDQIRSLISANMLCQRDLQLCFKTEEELQNTIGCNIATVRKMAVVLRLELKSESDCQSKVVGTNNIALSYWQTITAVCAGIVIIKLIELVARSIFKT